MENKNTTNPHNNIGAVSTRFSAQVQEMEEAIIDCLSKLEKGYGYRKWYISNETGIPVDILTPLLKRLKNADKIELIVIWCEENCTPNGSGYCLKGGIS